MSDSTTTLDYNRLQTTDGEHHRGLRICSKFLVVATLFLILAGSLVTSTGSGLSVPDWPSTYGHFMFLFPLQDMVGGIFYEHGHRMFASIVGFITLVLSIWMQFTKQSRWIKTLSLIALFAVVTQGVLGGLTVLFFLPTPVSVMHAMLAQTFFCITVCLAYSLSFERRLRLLSAVDQTTTKLFLPAAIFAASVYVQLLLGAIMRHTASGLAIPDFPTMAGQFLPSMNTTMLVWINAWRFEQLLDPVTLNQVWFHLLHRVGAVVVLFSFLNLFFRTFRFRKNNLSVFVLSLILLCLIGMQIGLGVFTVLSIKNMWIASLHVMTGASILGLSVLMVLKVVPVRYRDWTSL